MGLKTLLYRCPLCGHEPVDGRKDEVRCPSCETRFVRATSGAAIRIEGPEGTPQTVPAARLAQAIDEKGGPIPAARSEDGAIRYEARVVVRRAVQERALYRRGALLGFVERLEGSTPGVLRLDDTTLELTTEGTLRSRWNLMDVRAVQTSSSSVQVRVATGEVIEFRFVEDSPRRWEALLHELLRRRYRDTGQGEIREFQPRISVR